MSTNTMESLTNAEELQVGLQRLLMKSMINKDTPAMLCVCFGDLLNVAKVYEENRISTHHELFTSYLETMRFLINGIKLEFGSSANTLTVVSEHLPLELRSTVKTVPDLYCALVSKVCIKFLEAESSRLNSVDRNLINGILTVGVQCFSLLDENTRTQFILTVIERSKCSNDVAITSCFLKALGDLCTLDVNQGFTDKMANDILEEVRRDMLVGEEPFIGGMFIHLMPYLARRYVAPSQFIGKMWETVDTCFADVDETSPSIVRAIFICCGLVDIFFPSGDVDPFVMGVLNSGKFWRNLQRGFYHTDFLTRKRTLFLFRRILDALRVSKKLNNVAVSPEDSEIELHEIAIFTTTGFGLFRLQNIWQEFMLIIETLEEKQIHVIIPVLTRFEKLISAAMRTTSKDAVQLHSSWLLTLYRRMCRHDSSVIRRWCAQSIFNVDYSHCPIIEQGGIDFFCGSFVPEMLVQTCIYQRSMHEENQMQTNKSVAQVVTDFFCNINNCLDLTQKKYFWLHILKNMSCQFWNGCSLIFVSSALAKLPPCNILGVESVSCFRKLLTTCLTNLDVHLRSAIQHFFVIAFTRLVDLSEVGLNGFHVILGCIRSDDSFRSGSQLWLTLVNWLKACSVENNKKWSASDTSDFVNKSIAQWLKDESDILDADDLTNIPDCRATVLLLLLSIEAAQQSPADDVTQLHKRLSQPMDLLVSMSSRAYLSDMKANRVLVFLLTLLNESMQFNADDDTLAVRKSTPGAIELTQLIMEEVLSYIARKITVEHICDHQTIWLYLSLIDQLCTTVGCRVILKLPVVIQLVNWACTVLLHEVNNEAVMPTYIALGVVGTVSNVLSTQHVSLSDESLQPITTVLAQFVQRLKFSYDLSKFSAELKTQSASTGRIRSSVLTYQWSCISWYVRCCPTISSELCEEYILVIKETLDICNSEALVHCLSCLSFLIKQANEDTSEDVLQSVWTKVKVLLKKSDFWSVFSSFLDVVFHPDFLLVADGHPIAQFQLNCFSEIVEMSEDKCGTLNLLISKLCYYARRQSSNIARLSRFSPLFVKSVAFGPISSKQSRFFADVLFYLRSAESLYTDPYPRRLLNRENSSVRIDILSLLAGLSPDDSNHRVFTDSLIPCFFSAYSSMLDKLQNSYANSLSHRLKHRTTLAILLLHPFLRMNKEKYVIVVLNLLEKESQPSVRFNLEWILLHLIDSQHISLVCDHLRDGGEKRSSFMSSLFTVIAHLPNVLPEKATQEKLISMALPHILPWCMTTHFNMRTFAHASLLTLWSWATENGLETITSAHSILQAVASFTNVNRSSCKIVHQLMDSYCFKFHPIRDYSLENLVHTVPRLTGILNDEWLAPETFCEIDSMWNNSSQHNLALYSDSTEFTTCLASSWHITNPDDSSKQKDGDFDVQKKMIPWRSLMPHESVEDEYLNVHRAADGLVLVTSLIDRLPNVGGLCRTSEIFGVSKFVVGSLEYVKDSNFTSLSVTSHKWIPIEEVRPNQLLRYLVEMKEKGFTVVGAEQTANSRSLNEFRFPQKTVLLLGNERAGIPVELMHALDFCIEIPQSGIVRSLNVHVSGAVLVWEYFKQWIHTS